MWKKKADLHQMQSANKLKVRKTAIKEKRDRPTTYSIICHLRVQIYNARYAVIQSENMFQFCNCILQRVRAAKLLSDRKYSQLSDDGRKIFVYQS